MNLTLEVWRQDGPDDEGRFEQFDIDDATPEMTLLELLDHLNERLVTENREPIAFDSDCREGICGTCGVTVDGTPHGPRPHTPSCQQHVRSFHEGQTVRIEPFRSGAFPVVRDLIVDRSSLDRVLEAGGYVSVDAGTAVDADARPVTHEQAETTLDFAACIGCGACVAACPNGSANLFAGAKLLHLGTTPYGREERGQRAEAMLGQAEAEFGPCSLYEECVQVCPAGIPLTAIAAVNHERWRARTRHRSD
jgi:succinate dehydrogenase / fumarate reductase iron-sulfur subunit